MKISDSDYMPGVGQQNTQRLNNEDKEENGDIQKDEKNSMMDNEKSEDNGETQDESEENGNGPVKNNIKYHE